MLPEPGLSANAQRAAEPIDPPTPPAIAEWTDLGGGLWTVGSETARQLFFHDAPPEVARRAVERLRPQAYRVMEEVTRLRAWPTAPADYIVCRDDRALNPAWGRVAARERLGGNAVEIDGGHSPFLTRPAELSIILDALARAGRGRRDGP